MENESIHKTLDVTDTGALLVHFQLTPKLINSLYHEAMSLAEDARSYFDHVGQWDRKRLEPMDRVMFSCESLKVTTRLMHAISWLLVRKAVQAGEMHEAEALHPDRRLGRASPTNADDSNRLKTLPNMAGRLVSRSIDLHNRLKRLEDQMLRDMSVDDGPARSLMQRIERAF